MKHTIALPIETKVREFEGSLLLALKLVRDGHRVAFGRLDQINEVLDLIAPDMVMGGSAFYCESLFCLYRALQTAGVTLVVLDTEGGVFRSPEKFVQVRYAPEMLPFVSHYLAWGPFPARILAEERDLPAQKITVTGNPAFDFLHPRYRAYYKEDAAALTRRYGDFFLINTNFSFVNHYDPQILAETSMLEEEKGQVAHERSIMGFFLDMIPQLCRRFPHMNVVIRPHPSEKHATYHEAFAGVRNLFVEHYWSARYWLYAAKALVHNGCTTGIESMLMDTPAVAYCPVENSLYDQHLANDASIRARSQDELFAVLERCLQTPRPPEVLLQEEQWERLRPYFYRFDGEAADRVAAAISSLDCPGAKSVAPFRPSLKRRVKRLVNYVAPGLSDAVVPWLHPGSRSARYTLQKFPGLKEAELREKIGILRRLDSSLPDPRVRRIRACLDSFWIEPSS